MAIFYLLPPRAVLGERFARTLEPFFPGLRWTASTWTELAETLAATVTRDGHVFVVYEEDLPPGEEVSQALADGFGAEAGDEIIMVQPGTAQGDVLVRRLLLEDSSCAEN